MDTDSPIAFLFGDEVYITWNLPFLSVQFVLGILTLLYTTFSLKFLVFKNRNLVPFSFPLSPAFDKADILEYLCLTGVVYLEHKSRLQIRDMRWQGKLCQDLSAHKSLCGHGSAFQELELRLMSSPWLIKTSTNFRHIYLYGWGMGYIGGRMERGKSSKK